MEKKRTRKYNIKGTVKQKKVLKALEKTNGSISRAMVNAGYSLASAKNPKNVTESVFFKENLDRLDDGKYLIELDDMAMSDDDKRAKLQAIDMLFKLKSRYPKESIDIDLNLKRKDLVEPD
jgi:hypothetical protein